MIKALRVLFVAVVTLAGALSVSASGAPEIRLVLQITVDQLRGDLPGVVMDRLGEGGFRYLYEHGTVYLDAHHRHANTETIVGHTTLATGADPSAHGMIGNVWLDRTTGALVYNIEDPTVGLLTAGADVDDATEIDPTQKTASTEGRSPRAIAVSTFSDELALHTAGRAKVFGVSVKDRGAVSMAGHAGTAYWFSKKAGEFVTSTYYADAYPQWVVDWNHRRLPFEHAGTSWQLDRERSTYLFGDADDQPWETDVAGFGRTFPHSFGPADSPYLTTLLTLSPVGDELTLDFAKTLIVSEGLGADAVSDYLSVSFSSTDYVGHVFGPSSLEAEDNLLRLDRTLAGLLAFVDEHVGLEHTLVVLSADHGGPDAPGYLQQLGIPSHYFDPESLDKEPAVLRLKERFGIGGELFKTYFHPYVYLNRDAIADLDPDAGRVGDRRGADGGGRDRLRRAVDCAASRRPPGCALGPFRARQLPPRPLRRHLRGLRAAGLHQRFRRPHGGGNPRFALALRHLRADHLCRRGRAGAAHLPPRRDRRRGADPGGGGRDQASVGCDRNCIGRGRLGTGSGSGRLTAPTSAKRSHDDACISCCGWRILSRDDGQGRDQPLPVSCVAWQRLRWRSVSAFSRRRFHGRADVRRALGARFDRRVR